MYFFLWSTIKTYVLIIKKIGPIYFSLCLVSSSTLLGGRKLDVSTPSCLTQSLLISNSSSLDWRTMQSAKRIVITTSRITFKMLWLLDLGRVRSLARLGRDLAETIRSRRWTIRDLPPVQTYRGNYPSRTRFSWSRTRLDEMNEISPIRFDSNEKSFESYEPFPLPMWSCRTCLNLKEKDASTQRKAYGPYLDSWKHLQHLFSLYSEAFLSLVLRFGESWEWTSHSRVRRGSIKLWELHAGGNREAGDRYSVCVLASGYFRWPVAASDVGLSHSGGRSRRIRWWVASDDRRSSLPSLSLCQVLGRGRSGSTVREKSQR